MVAPIQATFDGRALEPGAPVAPTYPRVLAGHKIVVKHDGVARLAAKRRYRLQRIDRAGSQATSPRLDYYQLAIFRPGLGRFNRRDLPQIAHNYSHDLKNEKVYQPDESNSQAQDKDVEW